MKKIKSLIILGTLLVVGFAASSQTITYRFNNLKIVQGPTNDTLYFDVEAKSNVGTTYTTGFNIKINFSTTAFGVSAVPIAQKLILPTPTGYNFNTLVASAGTSRFTSSFLANRLQTPFSGTYDIAFLSNLTTTYQGVVRYKMLITGTGNAGLEFYLTGAGSMSTGNHYVLASGGTVTTPYTLPILADNNLLTLPTDPNVSLLFSEIGDPSNTTTNFVEVYNAGATTVDFTNHYPWYLNFNGSSSVQLTGTLAAGAKYTVAYNNTDFTPSLVSTGVGTGGTTNYLLTTYGDYSTGTAIDAYNGTLTGFDYTGKHAVRIYNIVTPNTTPTASEWAISAAQNIDMTPGSHRSTITWDGVPNNDWRSRGNWAENLIPDAGHNVSIPNAGAAPVVSSGDNAYAYNLTITGSLTIQSDGILGDGSLITYGTVTGNTTVQRFLAADRYWYVTKPVTSATANVFLHLWMYTYNEPTSNWGAFISNETTPLVQMQGYAVWTSSVNPWHQGWQPVGDTTTAYTGILNTGTISTSLTKSGDGWNFTGNPYPSAVDWAATTGWTKTNLSTNAYTVWIGTTNGTYTVGSGGTNGVTQYIPAAHGFFVNVSSAGTLGVSNAVRTHNSQVFYKTEENMLNRLSLTISNGNENDETVIYFNESATTEMDYEYDAPKLLAEGAPQAFTMMGAEKMAINTVNNPSQTTSVILGVNTPVEGGYTLTASNIESFDASIPIYLEDVLTGSKINLREMSTYSFSSGEGTSERFVVHFAEYQGIGDNLAGDIHGIYAGNRSINVDFSAVSGEIVIYDILGQEISRTAASNGLNTISVPQGNAVYVVKVISDKSAVTKKVFVK